MTNTGIQRIEPPGRAAAMSDFGRKLFRYGLRGEWSRGRDRGANGKKGDLGTLLQFAAFGRRLTSESGFAYPN